MDACHLLVGRPWQCDRNTNHDGFKNTYSFEVDRVKIMLAPLRMIHVPKPSLGEGSILLTRTEAKRALTECDEGFAIVVRKEKDPTDIPSLLIPLVMSFLMKFLSVFHL